MLMYNYKKISRMPPKSENLCCPNSHFLQCAKNFLVTMLCVLGCVKACKSQTDGRPDQGKPVIFIMEVSYLIFLCYYAVIVYLQFIVECCVHVLFCVCTAGDQDLCSLDSKPPVVIFAACRPRQYLLKIHLSMTRDATVVPLFSLSLLCVTCVNICVALCWLFRQMLSVYGQPPQTRGLSCYKQASLQVLGHTLELPQQK